MKIKARVEELSDLFKMKWQAIATAPFDHDLKQLLEVLDLRLRDFGWHPELLVSNYDFHFQVRSYPASNGLDKLGVSPASCSFCEHSGAADLAQM